MKVILMFTFKFAYCQLIQKIMTTSSKTT